MVEQTLLHLLRRNHDGFETVFAEQQRVFPGKLKSYGGKIMSGQTIAENMCDETREESGIIVQPEDIEIIMVIDYYNDFGKGITPGDPAIRMYAGVTEKFSGEPQSTDEMKNPFWQHTTKDMPYDRMLMGDDFILPRLLNREQGYCWMLREAWKPTDGSIVFTQFRGAYFRRCDPFELIKKAP